MPARSSAVVYRTIEEETGRPWGELFCEFDETPLGSASIGQVHRARLRSDGAEVAVKVQYPEVRDLFRTDMAAIRSFLGFASPKHLFTIGQLEKQLGPECDYLQEARNLQEVAANMTKHGFMPREVVVPRPHLDVSTSRMLVMELLRGPKLSEGLREYMQRRAASEGKTAEELGTELRRRAESGGSESRYHGPSAAQIELYDTLVNWRDWLLNLGVAVLRATPLIGRPELEDFRTVRTPNIPRMVDTLMRVHGAQLLWDGVLNVNPHAGNFLLLDDESAQTGAGGGARSRTGSRAAGRIGLIDYGATHRMTREERLIAALTYAALGRRDVDLLQLICEESGYKSKWSKKEVTLKMMQFSYDSFGREVMGGLSVIEFSDKQGEEDPWEQIPDECVLVQVFSIRLRAMALAVDHPITCSDWWGPMAEQLLAAEGLAYEGWDRALLRETCSKINPTIQKRTLSDSGAFTRSVVTVDDSLVRRRAAEEEAKAKRQEEPSRRESPKASCI